MRKPQTRMTWVVRSLPANAKVRVRVVRTSGADTVDTKAGSTIIIRRA